MLAVTYAPLYFSKYWFAPPPPEKYFKNTEYIYTCTYITCTYMPLNRTEPLSITVEHSELGTLNVFSIESLLQ